MVYLLLAVKAYASKALPNATEIENHKQYVNLRSHVPFDPFRLPFFGYFDDLWETAMVEYKCFNRKFRATVNNLEKIDFDRCYSPGKPECLFGFCTDSDHRLPKGTEANSR